MLNYYNKKKYSPFGRVPKPRIPKKKYYRVRIYISTTPEFSIYFGSIITYVVDCATKLKGKVETKKRGVGGGYPLPP